MPKFPELYFHRQPKRYKLSLKCCLVGQSRLATSVSDAKSQTILKVPKFLLLKQRSCRNANIKQQSILAICTTHIKHGSFSYHSNPFKKIKLCIDNIWRRALLIAGAYCSDANKSSKYSFYPRLLLQRYADIDTCRLGEGTCSNVT